MLYLIATPIGNLKDIGIRAIEALKESDYILCEDTRRSRILCQHYQISSPLTLYHRFNEMKRMESILCDLKKGLTLSLISDAGTPLIADPGQRLLLRCRHEQIPVTAVPGPCALIVALTLSGFDPAPFQFLGFLPRKAGARKRLFEQIVSYEGTTICYETAPRVVKSLTEAQDILSDHRVAVARELTKLHEQVKVALLPEILAFFQSRPPKGECVLLFSR
jgi:16S rRNA (cytidine1402-2'-O)-methyltransferase